MEKKKKPKLNMKRLLIKLLAILMLAFIVFTFVGTAVCSIQQNKMEDAPIAPDIQTEIYVAEELPVPQETVIEQVQVQETYSKQYASTDLNIRKGPGTDTEILKTVSTNTELQIVDGSEEDGWVKIKIEDDYYYVSSKYLSDSKVEIKVAQVTSRSSTSTTARNTSSTGVLTKSKGVNYYNGHKETWYSQKVLPGGGLKIPGRHVDDRGLVCDVDGYICVASSDYKKGTVVQTSLGAGKVYDCGCASGTIDIYTNW